MNNFQAKHSVKYNFKCVSLKTELNEEDIIHCDNIYGEQQSFFTGDYMKYMWRHAISWIYDPLC